jgi:acyl carrier protein
MIPATGSVPSQDNSPSVWSQITQLIAEHFAWVPLSAPAVDMQLRDGLGLDSLHLVELQVAIEDAFQVVFDPTDDQFLDAFTTIGALETYVRYLLARES